MFKDWDKVKLKDWQKWVIVENDEEGLYPYFVMLWVDNVNEYDEDTEMWWYKGEDLTLIVKQLDIEFYGKYFKGWR